ncbi:sugar ABC transporter substrate-binding protein [Lactonifactor longoviformis]|uniref:Multiple sugar transport system substrate-binding protein n=1 Tax=Lactonifactor longoviformis DSM 17459 TaxID=1122155 RepID=A0A1M4UTR9_9CLOT|nr:sugar ABC transporter substrate-binding protein [Lactonifactor longoviformis]POP34479.1 sugar ABC transporter substrate-binding protein [Lactonifactor longoviformis]SHE60079.1 multiple sugar transport system substrate-binding protein [Lactonifactor longoviformis DSM 17459]
MRKKRLMGLLLTGVLSVTMLAGCGGNGGEKTSSGSKDEGKQQEASGEKQTIEFWYHDGNPTSNPIFEELIKRFEDKYPQYEVKYVGLPADSYLQKYNTAVATNTVPDVVSIRDMDVSSFINQDALMCLDDVYEEFPEKENLNEAVIEATRLCSIDKKLYCLPQYITTDISWCNTQLMKEKGIEVPKTLDEFMEDCEKYADPDNGSYFYSLRGGAGSMENLFDFIFTYADQDSMFDEEGNCVLSQPIFAEAMDKYASIYWNGWTSKDSVTNSFKEMVAEFGSKTSMYISHNSSSLAEHKKNLGEGNFENVIAPANKQGNVVTKNLSFTGYSVMENAKNKEGAIAFIEYLVSCEGASYLCEQEGRVPINNLIYDEEWYKNDPYNGVYRELMEAENVKFLTHPVWLTQWNEFRSKYQEPGFQAVLLKEKTSEEVLKEWADYLTAAQKEYLEANK